MGLVAVYGWYAYAAWYNGQHGGHYTFNDLWPIWGMDPATRQLAWDVGRRILVFQVFDTSVWVLIGIAFTALVANFRKLPGQLILLNFFLLLGSVLYILFWFQALNNHDYYFINPMITLAVLLVSFLWMIKRHYPELLQARWSRWAMVALLAFNVAYTAQNMRMRYDTSGTMTAQDLWPIYHEAELAHWNGLNYWSLEPVGAYPAGFARLGDQAGRPGDLRGRPDDRRLLPVHGQPWVEQLWQPPERTRLDGHVRRERC